MVPARAGPLGDPETPHPGVVGSSLGAALRALQGVAAAMLVSAGMAWVAQAHPPAERDLPRALWTCGGGQPVSLLC